MTTSWKPTSPLAYAVYAAGFLYDPDQDIIYSRQDALQRKFGYAYGYDLAALGMNAVLDCEPIFFDYDGKHWMIELWKGQYGLETGCEIGVYTRPIGPTSLAYSLLDATVGQRPGDSVESHNLFYDCASDDDMLQLSSKLSRDGRVIFTRGPRVHWWLTGFKWGLLSDPRQLSMDVSITLKDTTMRDAFLHGIAGRSYANVKIEGTRVSFTFDRPYAVPQPPRLAPVLAAVEAANETIVAAYDALGLPNNDPNGVAMQCLDVMGLGLLHRTDLFGLTVSRLALEVREDISSVVAALSAAWNIPTQGVEGWLGAASQGFSAWVDDVEEYLDLPLDFSCYVEVDNRKGSSDLLLKDRSATSGTYAMSGPPSWIPRGTVGRFVLRDPKPSLQGSKGSVTYAYCDQSLKMTALELSFACPTLAANEATSNQAAWRCFAKSGDPSAQWSTWVPRGGHPLYLSYVAGGGEPG